MCDICDRPTHAFTTNYKELCDGCKDTLKKLREIKRTREQLIAGGFQIGERLEKEKEEKPPWLLPFLR